MRGQMGKPSNDFCGIIRKYKIKSKRSYTSLSKTTGISKSYLSDICNGRRGNISAEVAMKLIFCLDIPLKDLKSFQYGITEGRV